jgi:hypothetical protein
MVTVSTLYWSSVVAVGLGGLMWWWCHTRRSTLGPVLCSVDTTPPVAPPVVPRVAPAVPCQSGGAPTTVWHLVTVAAQSVSRRLAVTDSSGARTWTWEQVAQHVGTIMNRLQTVGGLQRVPHPVILVMGATCPEVGLAILGTLCAGYTVVVLPTTASPQDCHQIAQETQATLLFCSTWSQRALFPVTTSLRYCISWDPQPAPSSVDTRDRCVCEPWKRFLEAMTRTPVGPPRDTGRLLVYGVHTVAPVQARTVAELLTATTVLASLLPTPLLSHERLVVFLPCPIQTLLAQWFLPLVLLAQQPQTTLAVYFVEATALEGSLHTVLVKVQPTVFIACQAAWSRLQQGIVDKGASNPIFAMVAANIRKPALALYHAEQYGAMVPVEPPVGYSKCCFVFDKIRAGLGFTECHSTILWDRWGSHPAGTTVSVLEFFAALGIRVTTIYQWATVDLYSANTPRAYKIGSSGRRLTTRRSEFDRELLDHDGFGSLLGQDGVR